MIRFRDLSAAGTVLRRISLGLVYLGRYQKRAILMVSDWLVLSAALWVALSLRLGEFYVAPSWLFVFIFCAAPTIGVATFFQMGLYRLVTRYMGGQGATLIAVAVGLSALIWAVLIHLMGIVSLPRSVIILYPILAIAFVWCSRQAAGRILKSAGIDLASGRDATGGRKVLIFGAGTTGVQLLEALRNAGSYTPLGFVDLNPTMWGQFVGGLKVYRPERMPALIQRSDVKEVLLAMPKANRRERQRALRLLESLSVEVRTLPAIEDLAAGRVTVSDLRPVDAEDLLGRDPVPPDAALMARNIRGKSVLVTGAGGSIGSELVRQILRHAPRRLVLLDAAEGQLYQIELEVEELLKAGPGARAKQADTTQIVAVLGSVLDEALIRNTISRHEIETIYHAAAFKHVPIVEHNAAAGLRNNTLGTAVLVDAAETGGVERFVLVSTDKAVRPTSIMGASKRLAEMILQSRSAEAKGLTVFTMVRFGNVLDSSGSVVRKFRRQIESGGPVTVTHRDMIRYFMSIPEAAALVIQAGAMAKGGEVFVLDMGEPVKIDDLARSMIRLMGQEVRDLQHPDGDISIEYTGLRHGEKMHEELLLGGNTSRTEHSRILRSHEPSLSATEVASVLKEVRQAVDSDDIAALHAILQRSVEGYLPEKRPLAPPKRPSLGNGQHAPAETTDIHG